MVHSLKSLEYIQNMSEEINKNFLEAFFSEENCIITLKFIIYLGINKNLEKNTGAGISKIPQVPLIYESLDNRPIKTLFLMPFQQLLLNHSRELSNYYSSVRLNMKYDRQTMHESS